VDLREAELIMDNSGNWAEWPALRGNAVPPRLKYVRGVFGKVHRFGTDYRWLAHNPEFDHKGLERRMDIGDYPPGFVPCWRREPDGYAATWSYPSSARDSDGRSALETQVLFWRREAAQGVAASAFAMLHTVSAWDKSIWWEHWNRKEDWEREEFYVPLDPETCPPVELDAGLLSDLIARGRNQLLETVGENQLRDFYASLLAGSGVAILRGASAPLEPLALAALLLPLDATLAESVSLAGGVLLNYFDEAKLAHWKGVVCQKGLQAVPEMPEMAPAVVERAGLLARSLTEDRPELASTMLTDRSAIRVTVTPPSEPPPRSVPEPAPSSSATTISYAPPVEEAVLTPVPEPAAPVSFSMCAGQLLEFLFPEEYFRHGKHLPPEPSWRRTGESLAAWQTLGVRDLRPMEESEVPFVLRELDRFVVRVKYEEDGLRKLYGEVAADLARSWLFTFAPSSELIDRIGLPTTRRIPAMHFMPYLYNRDQMELRKLQAGGVVRLLRQSVVDCGSDEIRRWARNYHGDSTLRMWMVDALQRFDG
jgi:hypothetical protein